MDFKKFGIFILILGILVLSYGGIQWVSNQPKNFNSAESKPSIFGGRDDLGNYLNVQNTNLVRAGKRKDAIKAMIAGGIIVFVGIGMLFSAKKKDE